MLTNRYLASTRNLEAIFKKITDGVAPPKFNAEHLKSIGFGSSGDRAVVPLLKDLGFLDADGTPLPRYHNYRDRSRSKAVLADALREAYGELFHIREVPTTADRPAVEGLFKSKHNSTDKVAQCQAMTFFALLNLADLSATDRGPSIPSSVQRPAPEAVGDEEVQEAAGKIVSRPSLTTELHYTIQVHLPATKEIEVFNAIFRSLRENLMP